MSCRASKDEFSLKAIFLALFEERLAADAESFGRAADLVVGSFEVGGDDFALDFFERAQTGNGVRCAGSRGAHGLRKITGLENVFAGRGTRAGIARKDHRSLEGVAKLADVAGPGVRRQHAARSVAQLRVGSAMDYAERYEKVFGEKQNISAALAERRNREHQDIQPKKKILAETAGLDGSGKIHVGEGDEARFDMQRLGSTEAFERALLQDAQQLALRSSGKGGDFIENNRAAAAELEAAEFALDGAGESAALVAEKFAFDEIWRKAGAIDLQKR